MGPFTADSTGQFKAEKGGQYWRKIHMQGVDREEWTNWHTRLLPFMVHVRSLNFM